MAVRFRVLGPVEAESAVGQVVLSRRRERCLLGVLLLHLDQVMAVDRLAELLWDGEPPDQARRVIHSSVSRLRASLDRVSEPAPESHGWALATVGDGYRMVTDPQSVDAHEFQTLLDQAARAAEPETRATRLRAALDLWRGAPLSNAATGWLRDRLCADLQERRLHAIEDLMDARLALRQEREVLPELARMASTHPTRERLIALHMRALYQAGRTADALELYSRTRGYLADELGLDPGPQLRELQQAILRDQLPLPAAPPAPDEKALPAERDRGAGPQSPAVGESGPPANSVMPAQLPADVYAFTGREAELDRLDALLTDSAGQQPTAVLITAIEGSAGVGKTALAVHWGHRLAARFPSGQLYLNLHGFTEAITPVEPSHALDRMLRALGVPGERIPDQLDDRAGLWRSFLADRRMLIVLDNAASPAQVAPLLPGTAGCLVVVTSRRRLASLDAARTVSLDTLPRADAVTLFIRTAGPDRAAGAPGLVTEVVELCGRLPLAIRIAAARLRSHPSWSVADLAARLRDHDQRLAELADEDGSRGVAAALDVSYQQLTADQQRLYRLLGLHPGIDVEPYAAAALASTALAPARRLLDQLLDANLLQEAVPGRYAFHDLVRSHAHRAAVRDEPEPARRAALQRLLDYYRQTVSVATGTAYPYVRVKLRQVPTGSGPVPDLPSPEAAGAWLDTELANLMAAVHHAADHDWPEHALQVAAILNQHLQIRGTHHDSQQLNHRTLAVARANGDRRAELRTLACLAWVHLQQCEYSQAIDNYQQIRELAAAAGDQLGEMYAGIGIADILQRQGWYRAAYTNTQRALELAEATGHELTAVWIHNVLGHLHLIHGILPAAQDQHRRALEIAERLNDQVGGMYARLGLAHIDKRQGRLDAARTNYRWALAVARYSGNRSNQVNPLLGLGDVARLQGCHRRAAGCYRRALSVAQATNNRIGRMEARHALGHLCRIAGEPEAALDHHQQALALATDLAHLADQARSHDGLAHAHLALGRPEPARQHWRQALEILSELDTEHTPEQDANGPAIRACLARLDRQLEPDA